jgi:hypothetical protein
MSQVVECLPSKCECLPSKCEVLSSKPGTTKRKNVIYTNSSILGTKKEVNSDPCYNMD